MATYLIIGASSGIGKHLALLLAERGDTVIGTYHTTTEAIDHPRIHLQPLDIRSADATLTSQPESLAGVVYCPGTIDLKPFKRIKAEDFIADFDINVVGAIRVIQSVLPLLEKSPNASITLFSTVAVQLGMPFHAKVAASKGAIEGLTRALAAEFAPRIRVNCIAPSLTDTPLSAPLLNTEQKRQASDQRHPMKRVGTTADVASMVEYLLSDAASWITGQVFHVDGGMSTLRV